MNKMVAWGGMLALLIALSWGSSLAHGTGDHSHSNQPKGQEEAFDWLGLVDAGNYDASWERAGAPFKSQITRDKWSLTIVSVREPLGGLIQRRLFHDRVAGTLPGMPDGRYLIIRYKTKFEKKISAIETVTLVHGPEDNTWRVIGYFIK